MGKQAATHGIGLVGAGVFLWLDLPLPWLFGPLCSCLIAALLGTRLTTVKILSDGMRTILGVAAGATVTLGFVMALLGLWYTLIFIPFISIGKCRNKNINATIIKFFNSDK